MIKYLVVVQNGTSLCIEADGFYMEWETAVFFTKGQAGQSEDKTVSTVHFVKGIVVSP